MIVYPWQKQQWEQFISQWQQKRVPHGLLLLGNDGLGQFEFAQSVAQRLLCSQAISGNNCACRSCILLRAGNHPDYLVVSPEEDSRSIKVDQIRQLCEQLNATSHQGGYRVAVISPANVMNRAASNALLKTLEEPGPQVVLILIADQLGGVLPTIVSRCQKLVLSVQNIHEAEQWLQAKMPKGNVELLLKAAEYAPLKALELSETAYFEWRDQLLSHMELMREKMINPIAPVVEWSKGDVPLLLKAWLSILNDVLRLQLGVSKEYIQNGDRLDQFKKITTFVSVQQLQRHIDSVDEARRLVLSSLNPNKQLLLERILLEL